MRELFSIKPDEWQRELEGQKKFFDSLGGVVPEELLKQREKLAERLRAS